MCCRVGKHWLRGVNGKMGACTCRLHPRCRDRGTARQAKRPLRSPRIKSTRPCCPASRLHGLSVHQQPPLQDGVQQMRMQARRKTQSWGGACDKRRPLPPTADAPEPKAQGSTTHKRQSGTMASIHRQTSGQTKHSVAVTSTGGCVDGQSRQDPAVSGVARGLGR